MVDLARRRMAAVGLAGPPLGRADEVVRHLMVVQSQDFGPACWSVAHRSVDRPGRATIEQLFDNGALLRTHLLRPTWHFVRPADIHLLLQLTGPRVRAASATLCRRNDLDPATLDRSVEIISAALAGAELTRAELATALLEAGIDTAADIRLVLVMMNAELVGAICSGARRGKHQTYALLSGKAPPTRPIDRDEARNELVLRYFTSHGPATVHDMSWWCSLTITDIRAGIAAVGDLLVAEEVDGQTFWSGRDRREPDGGDRSLLLQGFDEYIVGYGRTKWLLDPTGTARAGFEDRTVPNLVVVRDAAVIGGWRTIEKSDRTVVDIALHRDPSAIVRRELDAAAGRYGDYLGRPVEVVVRSL